MSKLTFSKKAIDDLNKNDYVLEINDNSITNSDEFKRLFIEEYLKGKTLKSIFEQAGFNINILGKKRYEQAAARGIRAYRNDGIVGLRDTRKENSGTPINRELTKERIILKQESFFGHMKD